MRLRILEVVAVLALALPEASLAAYGVRISDLGNAPVPPNPIRIWGKVTSDAPLTISDGRAEITVTGLGAGVGDFLILTGDWNEGALNNITAGCGFIGPAKTNMVYIPAGAFMMGNNGAEPYSYNAELPQHSVYLSGYWIGKYEVTRGEYAQFVAAGGYSNPAYWSSAGWSWKSSRTQPAYWAAQQKWGTPPGTFTQTDCHPVVGVTYYEAEAFCNWAGGRLPTEAQWEKAARWTGSYPNVYPWGNTWDQQKCNNWYDTLFFGYQTSPVGSYPDGASPCGCQDMAGNVDEWCKDWYLGNYYTQTPGGGWIDPQGPAEGSSRVRRGGGWYGNEINGRCASRASDIPNQYYNDTGFRLAR